MWVYHTPKIDMKCDFGWNNPVAFLSLKNCKTFVITCFVNVAVFILAEINRIQSGGSKERDEKETNGNAIPGLSDSPVGGNVLPPGQEPSSPEVTPATRPPVHRQFRKPDFFDSKLYKPTKLSEKVFIPVKDYPKVGDLFLKRKRCYSPINNFTSKHTHFSGIKSYQTLVVSLGWGWE